ncbi:hypothetical protein Ae201684P_004557 [Aphanomyces euteiches]|nr:hypothetical protein Ae201684P_004557 [Aphanomyces euteiches]
MSSLDNNLRHERVIALEAANARLPECAMIPKESRTHCTICTQGFTAVIRKSNCYKCGEVVCHGCNKKWSIEVGPRIGRNRTIRRLVRVCLVCSSNQSLRQALQSAYSSETPSSQGTSRKKSWRTKAPNV